jgi:hypothetical protein
MKKLVFLLLLCGCDKQEPIIPDTGCVICKKTGKPTIDTCGSVQGLNTLVLDLKKQGYECR